VKKFLLLITVALFTFSAFAGDPVGRNYKFDKAFQRAIASNDSLKGDELLISMSGKFNEFINLYARDWRTYYWKAYAELKASEAVMDDAKKMHLDSATIYLDRAEYLTKNNSECQILRAYVLFERIRMNPEQNKAKYGKDLEYYKNYAYRSNQSNPRYLLLEGMIALNDTVGKPEKVELAKKYFLGASYLYENMEDSKFHADPFWGKERNDLYMSVYGVSNGSGSFDDQLLEDLDGDIQDKQETPAEREEAMKKQSEEKAELEKNVKAVEEDIEKLDEELKDEKDGKKKKKEKKSKKKKKKKK
jgi:hypothetical protein